MVLGARGVRGTADATAGRRAHRPQLLLYNAFLTYLLCPGRCRSSDLACQATGVPRGWFVFRFIFAPHSRGFFLVLFWDKIRALYSIMSF